MVRKAGDIPARGTGLEYLYFIFKMVFVTNLKWSVESETNCRMRPSLSPMGPYLVFVRLESLTHIWS